MVRAFAVLACGALLVLVASAGFHTAADERNPSVDGPSMLIKSLGDGAIQILTDVSLTQRDRVERFNFLLGDAFNWEEVSAFSLGKYRNSVNPDQFAEYRELFGRYMINIYAAKMAAYSGEDFIVTGQRRTQDGGSEVLAEVRGEDRLPIPIAFHVRRAEREFKIYDVVIEGVSLLVAKRQEVTSVIARDGIDLLIAKLKQTSR